MAKKSIFDFDKWERKHVARMGARSKAIKKLFDDLAHQASLLGIDVKLPSDKDFEFKNYPALEKRVDELVKEVSQKVTRIIEDGEEEAWIEANAKNDALVDSVVKGTGLPKEVVAQWKQPNLSALAAFQARKIAGMGLSQRVWKLTHTAKQELELALDLGIGEGKSAAELSRNIRKYLNEPNKLFRRVRDEKGILRLSKAAKMYHPGRGVYRSSYKNALRLTQTEINMAYRSADHERWGQEPWVIGQRICLSNNHTLNGLPFHDICDDVQGVYPKDFNFVGWHPKCRCYKIPELAKREERIAYLKKMVNGEDVSGYKFSGEIRNMPEGFNKWLQDNAERIQRAEGRGTLPYFLRDNGKFFTHNKEGLLALKQSVDADGASGTTHKDPFEIAKERHARRTPQYIQSIMEERQTKLAQYRFDKNLTEEQRNNIKEIEKALGIKRGKPMSVEEADRQSANPLYTTSRDYQINCATCAPCYALRLMGFDITAKPNIVGTLNNYISRGYNWRDMWKNIDGSDVTISKITEFMAQKGYKNMTPKRYQKYFDTVITEDGLYELSIGWDGGGGHATIIQRENGVLYRIEPQLYNARKGARFDLNDLCIFGDSNPSPVRGIVRIDDKIFNLQYISIFDK